MVKKEVIPKNIGGVKIPRTLRKNRLLVPLLGHPIGRQIVADALVSAAAAAAEVLVGANRRGKKGSSGKAREKDATKIARDALRTAAKVLDEAMSKAPQAAIAIEQRPRRGRRLARALITRTVRQRR
jgi:hypothetical protein